MHSKAELHVSSSSSICCISCIPLAGRTDFTKSNNGLVTDAAMKFFRNGKLMVVVITSTFDPDTAKWQAVCMSVIAGQTTEHYAVHFLLYSAGSTSDVFICISNLSMTSWQW